jgi:hypothetical protein
MILKRFQKESLRDFLINITSALFISGVIVPFLTKTESVFNVLFSLLMSSIITLLLVKYFY